MTAEIMPRSPWQPPEEDLQRCLRDVRTRAEMSLVEALGHLEGAVCLVSRDLGLPGSHRRLVPARVPVKESR